MFKCFLPSRLKRTCDLDEIDLSSGQGCVENGREVYATQETCCTSLLDKGGPEGAAWPAGFAWAAGCAAADCNGRRCARHAPHGHPTTTTPTAAAPLLSPAGVISPDRPGQGICAVKIDECWVKDVPRATCIKFAGNESSR
jgi:hypothetical protein